MSAKRTQGDDLKDSKKDEVEDGGGEGMAMAEAEAAFESETKIGQDTDKRAADVTMNAESSRESKKRRVSELNEASNGFINPATVTAPTYLFVISGKASASKSNIFTEENFYLLHWIYRIRNASCQRGLRISFLQPDFLWSIYRSMMRSKKLWRTDGDIKVACRPLVR
jgi:hypothetical protein